jgi:dihydroxyacetone kinase-like protein
VAITRDATLDWMKRFAGEMAEHRAELVALDSAIGDGDHGTNMARGFHAVLDRLSDPPPKDFGTLFKGVGMALIGKVGGAAGPLYGSFYLALGRRLGDGLEVSDAELAAGLRAGYDGVVARGKAEVEDKTMLDAWHPALVALEAALDTGAELGSALDQAEAAARRGAEATIPMIARKGRASYLGERSRGHKDPGATSSHLIIKALADVVNARP